MYSPNSTDYRGTNSVNVNTSWSQAKKLEQDQKRKDSSANQGTDPSGHRMCQNTAPSKPLNTVENGMSAR